MPDLLHSKPLFEHALDLLSAKVVEDEECWGVRFPFVTNPDGTWETMYASESAGYTGDKWSHGNWFCGFWVGLLLVSYLRTGSDTALITALERMRLVEQRAEDANTHDIGFIFLSSAVPAYHITGDKHFARLALRAAEQLRSRAVRTERGAFISSWGPLSDVRGRRSSAIDTMANLRLLYWASEYSGDDSFRICGELHAKMTKEAFIRPDHSTFHAVEYHLPSGERSRAYTFQGYRDDSFWSRGQAWAVLGFTETAHATGDLAYLHIAHRLADKFLEALGPATSAPWDFHDPAGAHATRDTSASAITANALLQLSELEPATELAEKRRAQALKILTDLCNSHLALGSQERGLLKNSCYSKPHNIGVQSATLFGDYYFAEALMSAARPGAFRRQLGRLG